MKKVCVKRYKWAEGDFVLNMKMNGPDVMPVLGYPKVKKGKPKSMTRVLQNRLNEMNNFA